MMSGIGQQGLNVAWPQIERGSLYPAEKRAAINPAHIGGQ